MSKDLKVADAPRAGGETPTTAATLDLLADAAKRLREHAMRSPLDCGCNDVAKRLLEFSVALPSLLERQRDGERDGVWVDDAVLKRCGYTPGERKELIASVRHWRSVDAAVSAPSAERA